MLIQGSCHCGNISFDLTWEPEPAEIPARACGCSFCVKHGGVWTSNPAGALRVTVRDPSLDPGYFFGTGTGRFHVCSRCGVVPLVTCTLDDRTYAVVNVNSFGNVDRALLHPVPASFEGEDIDARLARRKRNWIGDVTFAAPAQNAGA
ncbi:hypothetical protein WKW77_28220 [Variovorax ureilyticus]|uniref:CENP-V/GFA domain-containing protein n=1 Tax=Variovorax ureilyticus TaxID=1836198 RepID=A0ABU8VNA1_9BURK